MQDSTAPVAVGLGSAAPVVFDVRSWWRRLAAVSDRRQRRGKCYALPLVLLLIVLAKLSGEDRPSGIADWVQHRRARLVQALGVRLARGRLSSSLPEPNVRRSGCMLVTIGSWGAPSAPAALPAVS
jgi:hypothetical protein